MNDHEFAANQRAIAQNALTNINVQRDPDLQRRLQQAYQYWDRETDNTQPDTQWEQTKQQIIEQIANNPERWQQIKTILATINPTGDPQ